MGCRRKHPWIETPLGKGGNLRVEGRSLRIGVSLQPLQVGTHFRFSAAQIARQEYGARSGAQ
jgi:hypothetical protein